jgi:hypothetical protein
MFERDSHFEQAQTEASVVSRFHIGMYREGIVNLPTVLTSYFSFIELRFDTRANKQTNKQPKAQTCSQKPCEANLCETLCLL